MRSRLAATTVFALCAGSGAQAQVTTDGSVGAALALTGPNYAIGANLGRQAGANLFHSFARFDVPAGSSAIFSGPANVANVIARVTGGTRSSIDGRLGSTIAGANLFLVNPRGIVFGPNASLDLTGAFHATTADYLKFADGSRFDTTATPPATLSSAPPSAFGFLGPTGPIGIQGASFDPGTGRVLSFVGNTVSVDGAVMRTRAADLRFAAVNAGEVSVDAATSAAPGTTFGAIDVVDAQLRTQSSGTDAPGRLVIRGGDLRFSNTLVRSTNAANVAAPPVELNADGTLTFSGGQLLAQSQSAGRGADLRVRGENVTIDQAALVQGWTTGGGRAGDIDVEARGVLRIEAAQGDPDYTALYNLSYASGAGGATRLKGDRVEVRAAIIGNLTYGSAHSGPIELSGRHIVLTDGILLVSGIERGATGASANIAIAASAAVEISGADWTGYPTTVLTANSGVLRSGDIVISAPSFALSDGAIVGSNVHWTGRGGDVRVTAGDLQVIGDAQINAVAHDYPGASGRAGDVFLVADRALIDGARVYSYSDSHGAAGDVNITAKQTTVRGSQVLSFTFAQGNAGSVRVNGDTIRFLAGPRYELQVESAASNFTVGDGGNVEIRATRSFELDSSDLRSSFVRVAATTQGSGRGGTLTVEAPSVVLDGTLLFSRTRFGTGAQGGIVVRTGDLRLVNGGNIVSMTEGDRDGSFIQIDATSIEMADRARIGASTSASGNAGRVTINAQRVRMTGASQIDVSSQGGSGSGGDLTLNIGESFEMVERRVVDFTDIFSGPGFQWPGGLSSQATSGGNAGNITLSAPRIHLDDARILSTARQAGRGGRVTLRGDTLTLSNGAQIDARSEPGSVGAAGAIDIDVSGRVEISGRSLNDGAFSGLYAETQGAGAGGSIDVRADSVVLDRGLIRSSTTGAGAAGTLRVRTGDLLVTNGGWIDAGASVGSSGAGGQVDVSATRSIRIRGTDTALPVVDAFDLRIPPGNAGRVQGALASTISSNTAAPGAGGNVSLSAPRIAIEAGGRISANSASSGNAGSVFIRAEDRLELDAGSITTQALASDGGNIDIRVGNRIHLRDSEISTSVQGSAGAGGNIFIDPTFVILDRARIVANAFGGPGGNISIVSRYFFASPDSMIDASSTLGVPGSVQIAAPNLDLSATLVALPAQFLDASSLLASACTVRRAAQGSRLVALGRGGLPAAPERSGTASYFDHVPDVGGVSSGVVHPALASAHAFHVAGTLRTPGALGCH
ncbi:MAG: filamentous hemagglutinin N-terminal domain-containing protein [Proteobacteria bacterium]|nr:filamentous hemagglutinin N-terminal domain-containing protein [Burkholderiales bacterium]